MISHQEMGLLTADEGFLAREDECKATLITLLRIILEGCAGAQSLGFAASPWACFLWSLGGVSSDPMLGRDHASDLWRCPLLGTRSG